MNRARRRPMQTDSSASFTCIALASAVECTATVAIPSSFAARKIEVRFPRDCDENFVDHYGRRYSITSKGSSYSTGWPPRRVCGHYARFWRDYIVEVFIASISSSLSPADTRDPISIKAFASGLGRR